MNKIVAGILFLLLANSLTAQILHHDSLVGVWRCKEVMIASGLPIPKEEMQGVETLKQGFMNSRFSFHQNGLFEWQFQNNAPTAFKELAFLNNQKWSVDRQNELIHIGEPKENLMQISVRKENGAVFFVLADMPLLLRVQKE